MIHSENLFSKRVPNVLDKLNRSFELILYLNDLGFQIPVYLAIAIPQIPLSNLVFPRSQMWAVLGF